MMKYVYVILKEDDQCYVAAAFPPGAALNAPDRPGTRVIARQFGVLRPTILRIAGREAQQAR